ncbi:MAG: hypothetical protein WAW96_17140 [Alphaproteobacteria bacterium]
MRNWLFGFLLSACMATAAAASDMENSDRIVRAIDLSYLGELLTGAGQSSRMRNIGGANILVVSLDSSGDSVMHIAGAHCATGDDKQCDVLEFFAYIVDSQTSDEELSALNRKFELQNIERVDANHIAVTSGMVLMGGVTVENIGSNIGFFIARLDVILRALRPRGLSS